MPRTFSLGQVRGETPEPVMVIVFDEIAYDIRGLAESYGLKSLPLTMAETLKDWEQSFDLLTQLCGLIDATPAHLAQSAIADPVVLAPIPRPGKVLCAAANYSAHVAEMAKTGFTGPAGATVNAPVRPDRPYHFLKATSCMTGPEDDIRLPSADHHIDWEVELGAVIGRPAKGVSQGASMQHVAGYVIVNDVSCRAATWREDRPNLRSDWLAGKSYDTFLPTGPWFLPAAFVPAYRDLRLQLSLNGAAQQDGYASDMIFSLEEQIEYLSAMLTLEPGDLIATGTPAGVGQGQGKFLKPGDLVESAITGMGKQRNRVSL